MNELIFRESRAYLVIMLLIYFVGIIAVVVGLLESVGFPIFAAIGAGVLFFLFLLRSFRSRIYFLDFYHTHFEKKYLFSKKIEILEYKDISKVEKLESLYYKNLHIFIKDKRQPLNIQYSNKLHNWLNCQVKR
jgi:hypothetical protein